MLEVGCLSFIGQLNTLYLPTLRLGDIFEIVLLIFLIYKVIIGLRNTRAMVLLKGILILFIFYNIAFLFKFEAILVIFESAITLLIFAIIVVFQPELRRFLEQIGTKNLTGKLDFRTIFKKDKEVFKYYSDKTISELSKACYTMSPVKTGALIVLERDIPLTEYIESGLETDSTITSQLVVNMFEKNTPMHDGAMVIVKDRIAAATCYLPLSENTHIGKHMGTRHRAAIGVTEATDCVVIVVSEETGFVSLAVDGKINYNLSKEELFSLLSKYQVRKETIESSAIKDKVSLKHFFRTEDLSTRIVSIVVGIVGWMLLINISNPVITQRFEDIPIEFINTSIIESTGKTYEIVSEDKAVVEVTERRSIIDSLRKEDIAVIADMSKLSVVNAVPLYGVVDKYPTVDVKIVDNDTVNITLDSIISREIDVTLDKFISEDSKTFVPILESEVKTIIITGGKSLVDKIDKVVFSYDVSDAADIYHGVAYPVVYDRNGDVIDNSLFEFSTEVLAVTGKSYPIKEIPLSISVNSDSINGYTVSSVKFEPETVKIAGTEEFLSNINELTISMDVNLSPDSLVNNQFVKTLRVAENLPEGAYFASSKDEIEVTLTFEEYKTKTITFEKEKVELRGLSSECQAMLGDEKFSITISGDDEILKQISKDSIIPYIDLSGLEIGEYNLIMQFVGLDDVILTSNISAKVIISERG